MKDDLFDHLKHKLSETSVPDPDRGWQKMSALLDAQVDDRPAFVRRAAWYIAAASVLLIAGGLYAYFHESLSYQHTNALVAGASKPGRTSNSSPASASPVTSGDAVSGAGSQSSDRSPAASDVAHSGSNAGSISSDTSLIVASSTSDYNAASGKRAGSRFGASSGFGTASGAGTRSGVSTEATNALSRDLAQGSTSNQQGSLTTGQIVHPEIALSAEQDLRAYPQATSAVRRTALQAKPASLSPGKTHVTRWGLEVGVGANIPGSMRYVTVNSKKQFEPGLFPAVQVDYRFNSKLSLSSGVTFPSPVSYTNSPTNAELKEVTDTLSSQSASYVTKTSRIGRVLYVDIPLMLKYRLFKHVSIEGGGQLSYLVHTQMETNTLQYTTYAATAIPALPNTNFSNVSSVTYYYSHMPQSHVNKVDPRYVVGAAYQLHRFSADLQYQGALSQSALQFDNSGNQVDNRTSIVQLKLMYSLR